MNYEMQVPPLFYSGLFRRKRVKKTLHYHHALTICAGIDKIAQFFPDKSYNSVTLKAYRFLPEIMTVIQSLLSGLKACLLILLVLQLSGCASNEKPAIASMPGLSAMSPINNNNAAREAMRLQGRRYVPGGDSPAEGFDCSGLVYYVYKKQGMNLPRDSWNQAHQLPAVHPDQRQPGDLVFFTMNTKPYSHVGIYIGDDKFVHAPSTHSRRVMVSDLQHPYWHKRFTAVRRPAAEQISSANKTDNLLCQRD